MKRLWARWRENAPSPHHARVAYKLPTPVKTIPFRFRRKMRRAVIGVEIASLKKWEVFVRENCEMVIYWDWGDFFIVTGINNFDKIREVEMLANAGDGLFVRWNDIVSFYTAYAKHYGCSRITWEADKKGTMKLYEKTGAEILSVRYVKEVENA